MGSRLNRFAVVVLAVVAVCSCQALRPGSASTARKTIEARPGIGMIEHRGRFYRMEDLMDPTYRAASNDKFVREFGDPKFAEWAGRGEEFSNLKAKRRMLLVPAIWAGLNQADHSDR